MSKSTFFVSYALIGVLGLVMSVLFDVSGFMLPYFGSTTGIDTSSRQGYWDTYRRTQTSSGPSGSPGSRGGHSSGGQMSIVFKSGTNNFHGAVFEYFRDDALDSANAFDPIVNGKPVKSALRQHQFGTSFGGPLVKDRAFFHISYEGYRLDSGINFVEAVPSAAARARAVPSILPLLDAFKSPNAIILSADSRPVWPATGSKSSTESISAHFRVAGSAAT